MLHVMTSLTNQNFMCQKTATANNYQKICAKGSEATVLYLNEVEEATVVGQD